MTTTTRPGWSFADLLDYTRRRWPERRTRLEDLAELYGVARANVGLARQRGTVSTTQAERWTAALGVHPRNIWPDWPDAHTLTKLATRWDVQPLLDGAGGNITHLSAALRVDRLTIHRAIRDGGLTDEQADRYAITLGTHPTAIWPDWV